MLLLPYPIATAQFFENETPIIDETYIKSRIEYYSDLYQISEEVMNYIVSNESSFETMAVGDMDIICSRGINKGKPVRARGVAQITECYFPEITDEQAFDVEFSLDFLAENIAEGNCRKLWSTCPI